MIVFTAEDKIKLKRYFRPCLALPCLALVFAVWDWLSSTCIVCCIGRLDRLIDITDNTDNSNRGIISLL